MRSHPFSTQPTRLEQKQILRFAQNDIASLRSAQNDAIQRASVQDVIPIRRLTDGTFVPDEEEFAFVLSKFAQPWRNLL